MRAAGYGAQKTQKTATDGRFPIHGIKYCAGAGFIPVDDIETDKVDASFHNGVLTVKLPKSPTAKEKVKKIAIKSN